MIPHDERRAEDCEHLVPHEFPNGSATGDGGSPITGYTATASPGGSQAPGFESEGWYAVVDNLINGETYTFTVTATNQVGTGQPSKPSNAVTPDYST